jgi:hypothetical protein
MADREMALKRPLFLATHQADKVVPAARPAHGNCGLWPCRCRLRSIPDLRQTASHISDDDFELCGRDPVGGDVCQNNFRSQLQKLASVQGLAHGMFQSNEIDGAMVGSIYEQF